MKSKKGSTEVPAATVKTPRLVKAAEYVARGVARTLPSQQQRVAPVVRPTPTPRSAAEARKLLDSLFGSPVRVGG
jgi:hypothetical protein